MRLILIAVGKVKVPWIREGCAVFLDRLKSFASMGVREVSASSSPDPAKQMKEETASLETALTKCEDTTIILLDEKGKPSSSTALATELGSARDEGRTLVFVIGGAYGFSPDLRKTRRMMRLSDFTLTHEMARLFLLEQLYRGSQILQGTGYHHG